MTAIDVKVEIAFTGTSFTDVTAYHYLARGVSISRGRDSETDDAISVGTCSLSLVNDDGRFSPDLPSSPYYPNVKQGALLRVSAYANGAYRVRFYGTIQSWAVTWLDESGAQAVTAITANDALGSLPSYTFRQAADEVVRNTPDVLYHWPLRASSGDEQALIGDATLIDNGGTESAPGGMLGLDEGTDAHPLFRSFPGERTLTSTPLTRIDGYWELRFVLFSAPTSSGRLVAFSNQAAVSWDMTDGVYATDYMGNHYGADHAMPTAYPSVVQVLWTGRVTCCAFGGTPVSYSVNMLPLGNNGQRMTINPDLNFSHTFGVGHFVILDKPSIGTDAAEQAILQAYANDLLCPRIPTSGDAVGKVSAWAGGPSVSGATVGECTIPALEGRDAADAMGALATGMGARLVDNLDGTLKWVPFADSTAPISLPAGTIDPSVTWQTDGSSSPTDCTVGWLDGTSYTASRTGGKLQSISVEGVHATAMQDRSFADWTVSNGIGATSRLPLAPFDLASMTEAQKQTMCSINPASRVTLTSLPAQMPSSLTRICEGYDESLSDTGWDLTLKLSPDIYSRLFILDDATAGVLDSTYILAP